MIPIRLNITGYFTTDIDVHVIPTIGSTFNYHGCKPNGGIVNVNGRVDNVVFMAGHKHPIAAIVFIYAHVVKDE